MVVVIDSSVPRRVARFQPVWRKCMTTTIRLVRTMILIGLYETNTIGYYLFTLSYRDVQKLLFERGVTVSHEAIRKWCRKFGQDYANRLRRRCPQPGDKWHLDEVFLTIHGERHYLWRAVDQDDNVLDILVQRRRNK